MKQGWDAPTYPLLTTSLSKFIWWLWLTSGYRWSGNLFAN
jgi:hypothetical protein